MTIRVAVMASGRGSNFEAHINAHAAGELPGAELTLLIVNQREAGAVAHAEVASIPWIYVDHRNRSRESFDREVRRRDIDLVVLAGFMRLLSAEFIAEWHNRIINIHPALLPSFPGTYGPRDALAYGVKVSGCTVHFVDEGDDTGPIILQRTLEERDDDTEKMLAARILEHEHRALPEAVRLFTAGRLKVEGRKVKVRSS